MDYSYCDDSDLEILESIAEFEVQMNRALEDSAYGLLIEDEDNPIKQKAYFDQCNKLNDAQATLRTIRGEIERRKNA